MRGKVHDRAEEFSDPGITPAYAGKRCRPLQTARKGWDHPRLCGEKVLNPSVTVIVMGSPPPMRGKVQRNL